MAGKPGGIGQQRSEPLHPPVDGYVIDLNTALDQQFLNVAIGQIEPQIPAHRDDDHFGRETEPDECRLRRQPRARTGR
jgi:hypothetical protein